MISVLEESYLQSQVRYKELPHSSGSRLTWSHKHQPGSHCGPPACRQCCPHRLNPPPGTVHPSGERRAAGTSFSGWTDCNCPWAALLAQAVKNPPAMQETQVRSLGWDNPLKMRMATHSSIFAKNSTDRVAWWATVHRVTKSRTHLNH